MDAVKNHGIVYICATGWVLLNSLMFVVLRLCIHSRFIVYRPRSHVILAALVIFHCWFIITRNRALPLTRASSAAPLSLGYKVHRQCITASYVSVLVAAANTS